MKSTPGYVSYQGTLKPIKFNKLHICTNMTLHKIKLVQMKESKGFSTLGNFTGNLATTKFSTCYTTTRPVCLVFERQGHQGIFPMRAPYEEVVNLYWSISRPPRQRQGAWRQSPLQSHLLPPWSILDHFGSTQVILQIMSFDPLDKCEHSNVNGFSFWSLPGTPVANKMDSFLESAWNSCCL